MVPGSARIAAPVVIVTQFSGVPSVSLDIGCAIDSAGIASICKRLGTQQSQLEHV
jgi:hypothetical protein